MSELRYGLRLLTGYFSRCDHLQASRADCIMLMARKWADLKAEVSGHGAYIISRAFLMTTCPVVNEFGCLTKSKYPSIRCCTKQNIRKDAHTNHWTCICIKPGYASTVTKLSDAEQPEGS